MNPIIHLKVVEKGVFSQREFPKISIKDKDASLVYLFQDDFVELRKIWIDKKSRRKGYGKRLVKELIKITKKAGVKEIKVLSDAVSSQIFGKFLISTGFKRTGTPPFLWVKSLN